MSDSRRLPERHCSETFEVECGGQTYVATV